MRPARQSRSHIAPKLHGTMGRGLYAAPAATWDRTFKRPNDRAPAHFHNAFQFPRVAAFDELQTAAVTLPDATPNRLPKLPEQSVIGPRQSAFTLIELLVCIAILAILAAILLPVYSAAKEKAYRASCVNNFKELGTGCQLFADEHGDQLPGPTWQGLYENYDSQDISRLPLYLAAYLGMPQPATNVAAALLMRCPSAARHWTPASTDTPPMDLARPLSYIADNQVTNIAGGILTWPFGYPYTLIGGETDQAPLKLSQLASPASSWAMTDADQQNAASSGGYFDFLPPNPTHGTVRDQLSFDWHVEAVRAVEVNMPNPQL